MPPLGGGLLQLVAYGAQDIYLAGGMMLRLYYIQQHIEKIIIGYEFIQIDFVNIIISGTPMYNNYISNDFENFKILYNGHEPICSNKNIFDLTYKSINNSKIIQFNHIILDKIDKIFDMRMKSINCSKTNIIKLPRFKSLESFSLLKNFNCSNNKLKNINKLQYINLEYLDCSHNFISILPNKMENLFYLNCVNNKITKLNNYYHNLEYLDFSHNNIVDLNKNSFNKLKYLLGSSNHIKKITGSNILTDLIYLDLSDNPLESTDNITKYIRIFKLFSM